MSLNAERARKLKIIEDILETHEYTHAEIARKFGMKDDEVGYISRQHNLTHTRKKTHENLRENERLNMVTFLDNCAFLDKYNF